MTFHLRYMIAAFAEETRGEKRKSTASNFSAKIEVEKNVLNDGFFENKRRAMRETLIAHSPRGSQLTVYTISPF